MEVETKRVDSQGRISLPPDWRRTALGENSEVIIIRQGENLLLKPKRKQDLTAFFDSITVDITPEDFEDPHQLKKKLYEA